ncbi:MAG: hydrogenase maturation nickel metallochaperone HypA [Kiloniellales bacterium]|nr:hydrogenase maturation nickel metallochaperone HypA [Kiloniellales bacterium]
MHEMALSQSLIEVIEEQARLQDFARVRSVTVELGCLGHVDAHALRFCFDVVTRRTIAAGSRLIIVDRPGRVACLDCGAIGDVAERILVCPDCGSERVMVDGGDQIRLTELEVN